MIRAANQSAVRIRTRDHGVWNSAEMSGTGWPGRGVDGDPGFIPDLVRGFRFYPGSVPIGPGWPRWAPCALVTVGLGDFVFGGRLCLCDAVRAVVSWYSGPNEFLGHSCVDCRGELNARRQHRYSFTVHVRPGTRGQAALCASALRRHVPTMSCR